MEEKELKILTCYHCGNTGLMRVEGEYTTGETNETAALLNQLGLI